jgi:hypothetical protein
VRPTAFIPFLGRAGYRRDFDDLTASEPSALDQGRQRRTVSLS